MPFFSIIIPTYNRAHLLEETISYIQSQELNDWECIIVDDGSTDETKQVSQKLIQKDDRISYVYQNNAERSVARNNGASSAKGDYLIFLDSDDAFAPNYLKELQLYLASNNNPKALIVSNFCTWDGGLKKEIVTYPTVGLNASEWLFDYPVSPSRACVHREIFQEFKFRKDIVIVEDSVLWVSIATKYSVLHFQQPLVWYRVHDGNSVDPSTNSSIKRLAGLKIFFNDELSANLNTRFKRKILSDCYFSVAQYYQFKGQKTDCFWSLLNSLKQQFRHPQTKAKIFMIISLLPFFETLWKFIGRGR